MSCHYCQLPLPRQPYEWEGHAFCCPACRVVFQVLQGQEPETRPATRSLDWLTEEVEDRLTFPQGELRQAFLALQNLHCSACAVVIERVLARQRGVASARANAGVGRAQVVYDPQRTNLRTLLERLDAIGYQAQPFDPAQGVGRQALVSTDLLLRLGVAGFAAANLMMLAVSLYTGMDEPYKTYFEKMSALLATPVVLFSAQPFYRGAVSQLRAGRLGMDVPISLGLTVTYLYSLFGAHVYFDTVAMFVFVLLIGRVLEQASRNYAGNLVERMLGLQGEWAVRPDGVRVRVADVQPGDVLEVRAGERVPVDGVILDGSVYVDESALTGEPLPVVRKPQDWVRSGGLVVDGSLTLEVRRAGHDSCLARVARMVAEATTRLPDWQRLADRLAARFVAVVLLVSASALLLWWSTGPERAVTVALSVLIITCPCALGLATPLAVAVAAGRAADRGLVVRGGEVWEKLERVTCVVLDKTGTLTEGRPEVRRLSVVPGVDLREALTLACSLERMSTHPLARAVAGRAHAEGVVALPCRDFQVLPGMGVGGEVNGHRVQLGRLGPVSGSLTTIQLCVDGALWATFELEDRLREEALGLVEELRARGLRLLLLTGDAAEPARRAGLAAGLRPEEIEAELDPAGKLARIAALQAGGERVLMIGDGLNDAPALKIADVGVAVAGSSELALDAADVLFLRGGLAPVRDLLRLGERTLRVLRGNFRVSLGYNLLALPAAVAGLVAPLVAAVAMPCSSLLVVANSLRLRRS